MTRSSFYRRGQVVAVALLVVALAVGIAARGVLRATRSAPPSGK